jgi:hypothetical protein
LENLFAVCATEMPNGQPRELSEKLFLTIKSCFIARDKGGHGEVQPDREHDFLPKRLPRRCFARISPSSPSS